MRGIDISGHQIDSLSQLGYQPLIEDSEIFVFREKGL